MYIRLISLLLALVMVTTSLPLQAMAETMPVHQHDHQSEITQEATCTTEGIKTYICDCGDSFTSDIPMKEHSYESDICVFCGEAMPVAGETVTETTDATVSVQTEPQETVPEALIELKPLADVKIKEDGTAEFVLNYTGSGEDMPAFCWQRFHPVRFGEEYPEGTEEDREAAWESIADGQDNVLILEGITASNQEDYTRYLYRCTVSLGDRFWVSREAVLIWEETEEMEVVKAEPEQTDFITEIVTSDEPALAAETDTPASDFTYTQETLASGGQAITITKYKGTSTAVRIPAAIEGLPVTKIASGAFSGNTKLQSVVIPEGVTTIAEASQYTGGVFYNCTALTSVVIPETVITLGKYAFYGCSALTSVNLPDGIESIPTYAFYNCASLPEIVLPASLKTMGNYAFYGCKALTEISLPQGLTTVESYALYGTKIVKLELPDSVTSVSLDGLSSQLTYLRWTAGIPDITRSQFQSMSKLETIILPEGVTSIADGKDEVYSDGWNTYINKYGAFRYLEKLKTAELPSTLTYLGDYTFDGCISLESVTLNGVKEVGDNAFRGCTSLKNVSFGAGLKTIRSYAFNSCTALEAVALPDAVTFIGNYAFASCSNMTELVLPSSLKEIGDYAFQKCVKLGSVELPAGLETIGTYAFSGCAEIEQMDLPDGLQTIESNAFSGTSITELELPDSVTSVSLDGLQGQLVHVRWTAGVPVIPKSCFQDFSTLKSIEIPEGVTEIADGGYTYQEFVGGSHAYPYAPFLDCYSLESVILPNSLTKIGAKAFSGCSKLSFIQFGKNLSYIASSAFEKCPTFALSVWPGTWGEQWAIDNGREYTYAGSNGVVEVTLDPAVFRGMQLVMISGGARRMQPIQDQTTYRFAGLEENTTGRLQIKNTYGDLILDEEIAITPTTKVSLSDVQIGSVELAVLDEDGNDVTNQVTIEWYNAQGNPYASGAALKGLPAGRELTAKLRLKETYGKRYYFPEDVKYTVAEGKQSLSVELEKIPLITVSGVITDGQSPLAGASVVLAQTVNGKYILRSTAITDKNGAYEMQIPALEAVVTASAYGYKDQKVILTELSDDIQMETVALEKVAGTEITLNASVVFGRKAGEQAAAQNLTNLADLKFSAYNETQDAYVEYLLVQGTTLILGDHSEPGDVIRITAASLAGEFREEAVTVTVGSEDKAQCDLFLKQLGSISVKYTSTRNEAVQAMVFDASGKRIWMDRIDERTMAATSCLLADGVYTVVLMGEPQFLYCPNVLSGFDQMGLVEGKDYIIKSVTVEAGTIAACEAGAVPQLEESRFYYTDPNTTSYVTSKTSLTAGQYFTLRAQAPVAEKYQGKLSDIRWIFEFQEGMEYYDGTLSVNGSTNVEWEYSEGVITVPVEDPSQTVRFCANATGQGEVISTAWLEFVYEGMQIRQPVGTAKVKNGELDFEITEKTFTPSITVSGTAAGNAEIRLYDNDVLVGQTQAGSSGYWQLTFDLYKPGTISEHSVYAEMLLASGTKVRSKIHTVLYQYAPDPVEVSTVSMYMGGSAEPAIVFNFQNPQIRDMSYSVVSGSVFTFITEFDCEDISRLSDVKLELSMSNGSTVTLDSIYDEDRNGFVSSRYFDFSSLPVNVAVSYVCDEELVFSGEHMADIKAQNTELTEISDLWNEIDLESVEKIMQPIEWDIDCEVEMPDELADAIAEYNAFISEEISEYEKLTKAAENLYGEMELGDDYISSDTGITKTKYEEKELVNFSVDEKIAEGFELFSIGADSNSFILIKTVSNFEEGYAELSVIDTTEDGSGASYLIKNGTRGLMRRQKASAANVNPNGQQYTTSVNVQMKDVSARNAEIQESIDFLNEINTYGQNGLAIGTFIHDSLQIGMNKYYNSICNTVDNLQKQYNTLKPDSPEAKAIYARIDKLIDNAVDVDDLRIHFQEYTGKALQVLGDFATVAGTLIDAAALQSEARKAGHLLAAAMEKDDINIWAAVVQQILKTETKALGSVASLFWSGLVGKALYKVKVPVKYQGEYLEWLTKRFDERVFGKFLDKAPGLNLTLNCSGLILDGIFQVTGVNESIDSVYNDLYGGSTTEKYAGGNAGGTGEPARPKIDPSGYIYEAVPSNRLPGVAVTCYEKVEKQTIYGETYDEIELWDAAEFDQVNPLITDAEGRYSWDVPEGWWQVKAELDGYETTCSEWLPVPPPQLEVNLGMVSYAAPRIADVFARPDSVEVTFSKYLRADTVTLETVTVTADGKPVPGIIEMVNGEASPVNKDRMLASKVRFVPDMPLADGTAITVAVSGEVLSYADVAVEAGTTAEVEVVTVADTLVVPQSMNLIYKGQGTIAIQAQPAELAKNETVQISLSSELFLKAEEQTVTLDENGWALVHIEGLLPGETEVRFSMCDGRLQAKTRVMILMPGDIQNVGTLNLSQTYIALKRGESTTLTAEVTPRNLADKLLWAIEKGSEKVVSVDASGKVTAINPGTGYILVTATDASITLTERCRVDVAEKIKIAGVQLGSQKVTTELYSTNYAELEVLLKLPQNYKRSSLGDTPQKGSVAIESARFKDNEEMNRLFELVPLDDRRLAIVPRAEIVTNAQEAKTVKGSYKATVEVTVEGTAYPAGELTLSVKKSMPKLTGKVADFNSFYNGQSREILISGGTVVSIRENTSKNTGKTTAIPDWLELTDGILTLAEDAPLKNTSGKVMLLVDTEEWRIPGEVTVNVKNSYKAPGLKLSATNATFTSDWAASSGVSLKLQPKSAKDSLADMKITGIEEPAGFEIAGFKRQTGEFTLKPTRTIIPGKIALNVQVSGTTVTVPLTLAVKVAAPSLKLSAKSVTLNTAVDDSVAIVVTAAPADHILGQDDVNVRVTDSNDNPSTDVTAQWDAETGSICVKSKETASGSYKLYVSLNGGTETAVAVKTVSQEPTVALKAAGNLDLSFPDTPAIVTVNFKNYSGEIVKWSDSITETSGKTTLDEKAREKFTVEQEGNSFRIYPKKDAELNTKNTYTLKLDLELAGGKKLSPTVSLKVKRTAVKLKLSTSKVTLNNKVSDGVTVDVSCTTKGYTLGVPIIEVKDTTGKISMADKLSTAYSNGKLTVSVNENTAYGATYKVVLKADAYSAETPITVTVPEKDKSDVTVTTKLSGSLDVIRKNGFITLTPMYKNCNDLAKRENGLLFYRVDGKDLTEVKDLFTYKSDGKGGYVITIADGAEVDHSRKYQVKLVSRFTEGDGTEEAESKPASLGVKMGSAKAELDTKEVILFAEDIHSRGDFEVKIPDAALNDIDRIEIKDKKYVDVLEIKDYENGRFAVGFQNHHVNESLKGKSVTVGLDVYLKGNMTEKANASLRLKVTTIP